jgi:hypothetical protein
MILHKHAKVLKTIIHHIQQPRDTIQLYKVKTHAGILGNECANAIARCFQRLRKEGEDEIYGRYLGACTSGTNGLFSAEHSLAT